MHASQGLFYLNTRLFDGNIKGRKPSEDLELQQLRRTSMDLLTRKDM